MDPLEIMLNLDKVIPYYNPVISADTHLVAGYEARPYFQQADGSLEELDWFLEDATIPDEFHLELNCHLQQKAMEKLLMTEQPTNLSFYYDAGLLIRDNGESLLSVLHAYAERGLDLKRIIIEIKESYMAAEFDTLRNLFKYLKTLGIRIAVDVEQQNGSLDRLALVKPNIIKVDAGFLKDEFLPHLYRDVYHSLSMLSRKIGATLLFKGISSYNQLNYAWRNGGHYYEGTYLEQEGPEFIPVDSCQEKIKTNFRQFVIFEKRKVKAQLELMNQISEQFKMTLPEINPEQSYDELILSVGKACMDFAFRVYICNGEGIQLSSNAEKNREEAWELIQEGRNKNWSWRPYFFENIMRMNVEKKGLLSDLYTDIERDELIRTYSYPISDELYVFLDIPYEYLYEQEGLL
ncbi:EAL-associated domain-containing protein [Oceanobacillus massiliensis]|uniref:EAL domain-containing protein n=1 Tax=Oceanobacillus massiliensis TaxID=1465765 RepID=UPI00028A08B2|nr:EAL-associated domain-containing protein [Oceanobacillus massiliensis]